MSESPIEWTDATWNPVRGCKKVSPGCRACYAETFAERWRGVAGHPYEQGFDPRLVPEKLGEPLGWKRPRRVFVNSMSDLFGEFVPYEYIAAVFGVMAAAPRHTFQVLTKRAERMGRWFENVARLDYCAVMADNALEPFLPRAERAMHFAPGRGAQTWPLPNVHLGVSVEDRRYGLPRIDALRTVPAALRFLSIEPLLEDLGEINLDGIGWVIVGGESGARPRSMEEDWVRSIRDQCAVAGVPFFYKQRVEGRRKVSLPLLDGARHDAMPTEARP